MNKNPHEDLVIGIAIFVIFGIPMIICVFMGTVLYFKGMH